MPLFLTPPGYQKNAHSNKSGSISFGQFFEASNQEHSMSSPLALIGPKHGPVEVSQDPFQVPR
jgi:hypothetical protein